MATIGRAFPLALSTGRNHASPRGPLRTAGHENALRFRPSPARTQILSPWVRVSKPPASSDMIVSRGDRAASAAGASAAMRGNDRPAISSWPGRARACRVVWRAQHRCGAGRRVRLRRSRRRNPRVKFDGARAWWLRRRNALKDPAAVLRSGSRVNAVVGFAEAEAGRGFSPPSVGNAFGKRRQSIAGTMAALSRSGMFRNDVWSL